MNDTYNISASIVLYKNDPNLIKGAVDSFLATNLEVKLFVIDNSPDDSLKSLVQDERIEYIFNNKNLGFGRAHNIALKRLATSSSSSYHLILNPDVSFPQGTLEELYGFMLKNPNIGLVQPKILNFQNELQFLCKRLPSPSNLFFRRFGFSERFFAKKDFRYEMKDKNHDEAFEAPSVSGCFMFFRFESLIKIGFFDERYFMYLEDIDISRRMFVNFKNIYYPHVFIYHEHARGSYGINRLLFIHILSAIKYFNKWGWFIDKSRKRINSMI